METTLRTTTAGVSGTAPGTRAGAAARLEKPHALDQAAGKTAAGAQPRADAPLRSNGAAIGGELQDRVARAQQALDYLDQLASQLEAVKGELSSKLAGTRGTARRQGDGQAEARLNNQMRKLATTLAARRKRAGGGVDGNLHFNGKPAVQRFRIRELDPDSLRRGGPQSLAFSVGGAGGPQLSVRIDPDQTDEELAATLDRALAPMGVNASLDGQGGFVFSTPEAGWPAVRDSIAISGRGRVATDEVAPEFVPQQALGEGNEALRASLREVVQTLERVRRSRDAASSALSAASVEMSEASTPPPQAEEAAQEFASTASSPDYASLLSLTSALVGVSRERVLALLGLNGGA